jgi:hypothetical protein
MESQGQSYYNALKIDLNRRFSQGIQAGVSYTFAKLLTDAAEDLFGNSPITGVVQNPYDRASLWTPSPNIVPIRWWLISLLNFHLAKENTT